MERRHAIALVAVLALAATAGCVGTDIPEEELAANATYDWETNATATVTVIESGWIGTSDFEAVYQVENRSEIALYRSSLARDRPLEVRSVKFRYPNGTVVGYEALDVETTRERTTVSFPATEGQFAFTATHRSKKLELEPYVEGSYRVILPPNHDVRDFLLGDVVPGTYELGSVDGQRTITWDDVEEPVFVRYYATRDRVVFWGIFGVLGVIALGGYLYFRRQINQLVGWRERQGLDIDEDEDDRRRPPRGP